MTRPVRSVSWLIVLAVAFVGLAVLAHLDASGTGLDHRVLGWVAGRRCQGLTTAAGVTTTLASPTATGLLAAVAALACWRRRRAVRPAVVVLGTVLIANGLAVVSKRLVAEQRPPGSRAFQLGIAHSFPSGHVTGTLALFGIVAVVVGRAGTAAVRTALAAVAVAATSVVALSRLYLGVHWVTDVAGGLLLGGAAVLAGSMACDRREARRPVVQAMR
ncbi:phosphatase PAP2 family protein [Mycolicibacterium madagascariense]|uniref:phosphatase PAP2 family protein n=1 Tax=Mycolicibacterium madagascariense TaxID=212765 RepID=UPI0013D4F54A|nr:phosphatase PAP2 family protein [Mycolicibacterium madagascariense]MCV7013819.1 phosphatase PAP2 family protein [Mycolicibacterium madagascariense]